MTSRALRREVTRAARLSRAFRDQEPKTAKPVHIKWPKALAVMGTADFIGYTTTHAGKTHKYKHEFAPGSKPLLCAGTRDGQLYLIGGRYRVTGRGIVDLSAKRREIDDRAPRRRR